MAGPGGPNHVHALGIKVAQTSRQTCIEAWSRLSERGFLHMPRQLAGVLCMHIIRLAKS